MAVGGPVAGQQPSLHGCPAPGEHYAVEIVRGDVDAGVWTAALNDRRRRGYRLAHVLDRAGATVLVFEHVGHA